MSVAIDGPPVPVPIHWGLGVRLNISVDPAAVQRGVVLFGALGVGHSAAHDHWIPVGVWSHRSSLLTQSLVGLCVGGRTEQKS